ncbi:unnamed protein product [Brassicogethes aeneus]|uniref:Uncharacterized protein n=1 Tax=Brassicogethes aeneus TaxID=1431903 RepID=A0A9P0AXG4_BRAAE|nr:unnamed protein product [Brassicogethes aeneus]
MAKMVVFVCLFFVVLIEADEKYTTKYDNIDYNEILANHRLLKNYFNCLLEKGNCTPEGSELKKVLPDALQTDCSKCSEKQKAGVKTVFDHLMNDHKDMWEELQKKYDPDGIYYKKYEEAMKKEGL